MGYITNNEIAVNSLEDALKLVQILTNQDYVTMISKEENLYIINYIYSTNCNRNEVVFQDRGIIEEEIFKDE
jgi:hypothetical protein